ncbi:MAG: LD-carboxypeptidase [Lentisphaeria bacterium]|nr:LD-carboxypeptidase [Lentisphaeria bacterium]
MKKFISMQLLLVLISGVFAAPAAKVPDPEIFSARGKIRDYTGVFPKNVKTIGIITPGSYPVVKNIMNSVRLLEKAGYKVKIYPNALRARGKSDVGYYAAMLAKYRIQDFETAWNDREIDMIICCRGGVGTEEVVAGADWSKLPKRPELYLQGYSAVTSILCALDGKGYGKPVAGPNVSSLSSLDPRMIPLMKKMYNGEEVGPFKLEALVPGDCSGKALAGLLSRFNKVAKANYNVNVKGRIIFIESVFCKAGKFRKELTELCNSKFFDGAAGIVFCHLTRGDKKEVLMPVLKEFAPKFKVPVYLGFPFGHHTRNLAIDFSRDVVISKGVLTFPAVKK